MVKDKRTYSKKIEHSSDISYENEFKFDNVQHQNTIYMVKKKQLMLYKIV